MPEGYNVGPTNGIYTTKGGTEMPVDELVTSSEVLQAASNVREYVWDWIRNGSVSRHTYQQ